MPVHACKPVRKNIVFYTGCTVCSIYVYIYILEITWWGVFQNENTNTISQVKIVEKTHDRFIVEYFCQCIVMRVAVIFLFAFVYTVCCRSVTTQVHAIVTIMVIVDVHISKHFSTCDTPANWGFDCPLPTTLICLFLHGLFVSELSCLLRMFLNILWCFRFFLLKEKHMPDKQFYSLVQNFEVAVIKSIARPYPLIFMV